ncbi:MAG TPA: hypothetical protein VNJ04_11000 [Gemmatimonadaceae bacterium]|nr:hypothetical protein [Gemmatimonadaceae bacterium]
MFRLARNLAFVISAATLTACTSKSADAPDSASVAIPPADAVAPVDTSLPTVSPPTAGVPSVKGMLDPNLASADQLVPLGLKRPVADALIAGRPYKSMTAVDRVLAKTLNEKQRDSVYARLWVPIDLNTASGEEILLIPGIGPRMRHEFEEYRPYKSMDQFRREMGKYVDKQEVARLERYVTIR